MTDNPTPAAEADGRLRELLLTTADGYRRSLLDLVDRYKDLPADDPRDAERRRAELAADVEVRLDELRDILGVVPEYSGAIAALLLLSAALESFDGEPRCGATIAEVITSLLSTGRFPLPDVRQPDLDRPA
ncbi:MAG: hypothetical protein AB1416_06110 [Actinomycetota bacterium]